MLWNASILFSNLSNKSKSCLLVSMLGFYYATGNMRGREGAPFGWFSFSIDRLAKAFVLRLLFDPFFSACPKVAFYIFYLYLPLYLYPFELYDNGLQEFGSKYLQMDDWKFFHLFKKRMNLKLINNSKLDKSKNYICCIHPHGFMPWGSVWNLLTAVNNFPQDEIIIRILIVQAAFWIPIYREFALLAGFCDVSRYTVDNFLEKKKSIGIVIGGAKEANYGNSDTSTLYINKRHGFIKMALKYGVNLVPIYTFGETSQTSVYWIKNKNFREAFCAAQEQLRLIIGIAIPLFMNVIPRKSNVTTVVGEPILVKKIENPTKEDVLHLHSVYCEHLKKLFEAYKEPCGYPDAKLNFV